MAVELKTPDDVKLGEHNEGSAHSSEMSLSADEEKLFNLIEHKQVEEIEELVNSGNVRVDCKDSSGMTPLDQACFRGSEPIVKFLLSKGATVHNKSHQQGYTCLMFAALAGSPKICQMLLDAGAEPSDVNSINRTASELAAFVGQHECVSVISSYIDASHINKILQPSGSNNDEFSYPNEFVTFIHDLTKTHDIFPVKLVFDICNNTFVLEHRKKLLFVVDSLFEKQLRCKEPNESQSIKIWIILTTLRELLKFVDANAVDGKDPKQVMLVFAKRLLHMEPEDEVRKCAETLLRTAVLAFPYRQSLLWQSLAKSINATQFGKNPTAFKIILQALFGPRFAETCKFCWTCGVSSAKKMCPKCKVPYCSQDCQKFDWPIHKKCCDAIAARPETSTYTELSEDMLKAMITPEEDSAKIEEVVNASHENTSPAS